MTISQFLGIFAPCISRKKTAEIVQSNEDQLRTRNSDRFAITGDILKFNMEDVGHVETKTRCERDVFLVCESGRSKLFKAQGSRTGGPLENGEHRLFLAAVGPKNCARLLDKLCEPSSRIEQAMLSRSTMGDVMALRLARATAHGCQTLFRLLLPQNGITASGARWLSAGLRLHGQLRVLDLSYNCCGDDGAENLARLVRDSSGLLALRLRGNCIGPRGGTALAAALATTTRQRTKLISKCNLEVLDLSLNCLGDAGATALARALGANSTLRELDVSRSMVTVEGAAALAAAMQQSSTLLRLSVRAVVMSAEEAAALEGLRRKCMDEPRGALWVMCFSQLCHTHSLSLSRVRCDY